MLVTGLLLSASGAFAFTRITADGSHTSQVLPASLLLAVGAGLCLPSLGNGAVHGITDRDAGLASGLQEALQQIGAAIGLAVLTTLALRRAATAVAGGADPATAITDGYVLALRVGAVVLLAATAIAAALLRRPSPQPPDPSARALTAGTHRLSGDAA